MDITFTRFTNALRKAEIKVSPAETLDAFDVLRRVGISDRSVMRDALSLTLAKSIEEKESFNRTFDRFYSQIAFQTPPKKAMLQSFGHSQLPESANVILGESLKEAINQLLNGDNKQIATLLQMTATDLNIETISSLREKQHFQLGISRAMGLPRLDQYLDEEPTQPHQPLVRYLKQYIGNEIKDYVDKQYKLHVDPTAKRVLIEAALKSNLNHLSPEYMEEVHRVVVRLAAQLRRAHKRRSKVARRGQLAYRKTIRQNMSYDGSIVELHWRRVKREPATVYVLCDVSNSVSSIARFLLLFLFELLDVLPRVRAFAFSSSLGEVTSVFQSKSIEEAIEEALFDWGKGNTDYGRAFSDFRELCGTGLNRRDTVLILGDGRSNFYNAGNEILEQISKRVKHVFWLNPETRSQWLEGDSEMKKYAPSCSDIFLCNQIKHIERIADKLVSMVK